jgi:hypothetical protein
MAHQPDVVAKLHLGSDMAERPNLNIDAKLRAILDECGRVYAAA